MKTYPSCRDKFAVLIIYNGKPCEPEIINLKSRGLVSFGYPENKFFENYWDAWAYYAKALKKWNDSHEIK